MSDMLTMTHVSRHTSYHVKRHAVHRVLATTVVLLGMTSLACSPGSLVDVQSPSTVVDPSQVQTATGAAGLRTSALSYVLDAYVNGGFTSVITMSGTITDELQDPYYQGRSGDDRNILSVNAGEGGDKTNGFGYDQIQSARVATRQALQALQLYASNSSSVPRAWQGEMYALQGYTVVWFAELYCSGIPLSESSLTGSQVPTRGLTTEELFNTAIALFDSAMVAGADSARFVHLASVGKARALLDLGQFAAADSAVQGVPTDFVYFIRPGASGNFAQFYFSSDVSGGAHRVMDREGTNGLVWSTDPRTAVMAEPDLTGAMLWPAKYNIDPSSGIPDPTTPQSNTIVRIADGLEARLIQAEAALARGDDSWLTTLNTLRATCIGSAACAPRLGLTASLPPLADPGPTTRLDTLMKERAMWLYLTGHREGDLRRMAHVYHRDAETLWPTGTMMEPAYPDWFPSPGVENGSQYGHDTVYGPDVAEHTRNPLYGGCYDTNP